MSSFCTKDFSRQGVFDQVKQLCFFANYERSFADHLSAGTLGVD